MKISVLGLIIGIVVGILLVGLIYYSAYYLFEKYQKVRHPFGKNSKTENPSEIKTLSLSEWVNFSNTCDNDYISDDTVFLKTEEKYLAVDESQSKVIVKSFNTTDKYQKWRIIFYKDPDNPFKSNNGIIYNMGCGKYIDFENSKVVLRDLEEPIEMKCPIDNFEISVTQIANNISNLDKNVYLSLEGNNISGTLNKKNASVFFVSY